MLTNEEKLCQVCANMFLIYLYVLRGHLVFSSPPQWPMAFDFKGFSFLDFIHYIYFPIFINHYPTIKQSHIKLSPDALSLNNHTTHYKPLPAHLTVTQPVLKHYPTIGHMDGEAEPSGQ